MKKPRLSVFAVVTLLFAAFTLGLFLGKNLSGGEVILSVPAAMQTLPPETTASTEAPGETEPAIAFPIDINTAEKEALMALPGIGEGFAGRILAYREEHGAFSSVEALLNVEGIGEKRLEAILEFITIGG